MSNSQERLIQRLTEISPRLGEIREESIRDFGELLPHLFFGDLTRYVVGLYLDARSERPAREGDELEALLGTLEEHFRQGDDMVQELISVSFLEHLPRPSEEPGWQIRSLIGSEMSRQLEFIG